MKKWIAACLSACFLAATAFWPAAPVFAQSSATSQSDARMNEVTSAIWSGLWSGANLSFGGFAGTSSGSSSTNSSVVHTLPGPATPVNNGGGNYAALGDSVAAGLGLPNPVQVPSEFSRCGRTAEAYPYEVAQTMHMALTHIACSGATAGDLFTVQRSGSPNLPPQLNTAFAGGIPSLITITAGANDAHWVQFITTCYTSDCTTTATTAAANGFLAALSLKLHAMFADIWLRSGGHPPQVVITGYYNPASAACASKFPSITPAEVNWISAEVSSLNQTIQNAASVYSFAKFVPVSFSGHDFCSSDPWVQGLNAAAPFHPTVTGQHVIASDILTALGH